jgi:peptidoglycan hydrolase-like protein with peptidoglycan-binding domain
VKRPTTCASYENRKDIPVQMCDKGDVVELAQEALNAWGAPVDADGYFGPRTDSAVRDFQRAHGLSVDGIVGPATWPILYEYLYAGGDEFDDGSGNTLDEPDGDPVEINTLDEPDGDPVDVNTLDEPDGDPVDEANAD